MGSRGCSRPMSTGSVYRCGPRGVRCGCSSAHFAHDAHEFGALPNQSEPPKYINYPVESPCRFLSATLSQLRSHRDSTRLREWSRVERDRGADHRNVTAAFLIVNGSMPDATIPQKISGSVRPWRDTALVSSKETRPSNVISLCSACPIKGSDRATKTP